MNKETPLLKVGEAWDDPEHEVNEALDLNEYYAQLGIQPEKKDKTYEQYAEFKRKQMRRGIEVQRRKEEQEKIRDEMQLKKS